MKFGKSKIVSKEKRVILKTKGQYLFTMKPSMFKSVLFAASKNGINYEKCTDFVKFIDKMDKKIESEYIDEVYEILYEGNILEDYNGNLVEVSI